MYCPIIDKNIQFFEEDISEFNTTCPYDCSLCTVYVSCQLDSEQQEEKEV